MAGGLRAILEASLGDEAPCEGSKFEPESSFKGFALVQDSGLDQAAADRLADLVFRGNARLVIGYDSVRVRRLLRAWLSDLIAKGAEQATIVNLQAQLINVAADASERDLRRGLKESDLRVNAVVVRRDPEIDEIESVFGARSEEEAMHRFGIICGIHFLIKDLAASAGVKISQIDEPDLRHLRQTFPDDFDRLDELSALVTGVPGLKVPKSVKYSQQKEAPTFPIVAKKVTESYGSCKYLIEGPDQWEKFVRWVEDNNLEDEVERYWIFQEFIESPAGRPTSLRVFVDCLGNVMASQLLYGPRFSDGFKVRKVDRPDNRKDDIEALLEDPDSLYFLDAQLIASNKRFAVTEIDVPQTKTFVDSKGYRDFRDPTEFYRDPKTGGRILTHRQWNMATVKETVFTEIIGRITIGFDRGNFVPNDIERELLVGHGFDPEDPRLPRELIVQARSIARQLSIKDGDVHALYLGLDFIRGKDGNWYFLEANRRPSLTAVKEAELLSMDDDDVLRFVVKRIMQRIASLRS